jgi:hypothetical protein
MEHAQQACRELAAGTGAQIPAVQPLPANELL